MPEWLVAVAVALFLKLVGTGVAVCEGMEAAVAVIPLIAAAIVTLLGIAIPSSFKSSSCNVTR